MPWCASRRRAPTSASPAPTSSRPSTPRRGRRFAESASGTFPLPEGVDQTRTFGTVALNLLSFELDIWGRLRRATEAARAELLASEENRKAVMTTLVSDVAGAYFNLLELDMELAIAKRTLAVRQESLQLIRSRERVGSQRCWRCGRASNWCTAPRRSSRGSSN